MCHFKFWYSNVITCTDSTVEHTEDEGLGVNILVLRCVRWQKLELSCRTSIREKFSQVNRSASNCLTSRSSKKKYINKKKTDEEENEILEYDSLPVMKNRMSHFWTTRPHVMMITLSLEQEIRYLSGRFFPLWSNFPCYGSKGISVTFFCFMHLLTLLFVSMILTCLYLYVYP